MADDGGGPLIDLGDVGKFARPVTVFIEKVSAGLGNLVRPWSIRSGARAAADAKRILAQADVEVTEIERRAIRRRLAEDARDQQAIEDITVLALPHIRDDAKPEGMDLDWIAHFYDSARLVSDKEMQSLWAKLLSGEANAPGSFGRRAMQIVSTLSKNDAHMFTNACEFVWRWPDGSPFLGIYDFDSLPEGLQFSNLVHLDGLGLLRFDSTTKYWSRLPHSDPVMEYHGRRARVTLNRQPANFDVGHVVLSQAGRELSAIAGATGDDLVWNYTRTQWRKIGYIVEDLE